MTSVQRRRATPRRRTARRTWRRLSRSEPLLLLLLVAVAVAIAFGVASSMQALPVSTLVLPLLVGGLFLSYRMLVPLVIVVLGSAAAATIALVQAEDGPAAPRPLGSLIVVGVTAVFMLGLARGRARLGMGVSGTMGEAMLVDLRDRLRAQGELPPLPHGWRAEIDLRPAHGASFSGDFIVSSRSPGSDLLELVLVDVSGKGVAAGTRALLLSGAFGGLLGSLPSAEFLPAANAYLLRQRWPEGFATAVYVALDLSTGEYEVRSGGHPPAVRFYAGSGHWVQQPAEGPILGVVRDATYGCVSGRLGRGDALLLYSDGLVETPQRDISVGIDRLLGEAERLVQRGFSDGARILQDRVGDYEGDDRALVLLWRN